MSWLNPSLKSPTEIEGLGRRWKEHPNLRIRSFLSENHVLSLWTELSHRALHFHTTTPGNFRYQYWADAVHIDNEQNPVVASFARWLYTDALSWISQWSEQALTPPEDRQFLTTLFTQGCYLDPHNDADGKRAIAFVLGLTRERWKEEEGGCLTFLEADDTNVSLVERRPPGWNTLDLFSVHNRTYLHEVQLLRTDRKRRAMAGWFYLPP